MPASAYLGRQQRTHIAGRGKNQIHRSHLLTQDIAQDTADGHNGIISGVLWIPQVGPRRAKRQTSGTNGTISVPQGPGPSVVAKGEVTKDCDRVLLGTDQKRLMGSYWLEKSHRWQ
jgi:hypothetical protein